MNYPQTIELSHIDAEDISDVLQKIEKSFNLTFESDTFKNTKSFGDICDIITSKVEANLEQRDDCTNQQAFNKIRDSIAYIQALEKTVITPDSDLAEIFPRNNRLHKIYQLRKNTGLPLNILEPKNWITGSLLTISLTSLIILFFNCKYGLLILGISAIGFQIAQKFGKEFRFKTVGEIAKMAARENYILSRRHPKTVNKHEITKKIKEIFIHDLELDPEVLSREALIS